MEHTNDMEKLISKIKGSFAEQGNALMKTAPGLKAVFCIGSSANNKNFPASDYQDFDIHFYFNKSFLTKDDLDSIKAIFKNIKDKFESADTAIDYCIMDKPWKMIPRKKINIGMHGTVINHLDFVKRIGPNYILGLNMFTNSEILAGILDCPNKQITETDFSAKAGGIGWLKENFYRLVNILDPEISKMSVPIREVAIYFGLTPLIHYYYLKNGKTANRKTCRQFFENEQSIPLRVKEAVDFIYSSKKEFEPNSFNNKALLNSAHCILTYIGDQFNAGNKNLKNEDVSENEYSDIVSALLGRKVSIKKRLCYFPKGDFSAVSNAIKIKSAKYGNVTPEEFVETLKHIVNNNSVIEFNRLYFFEQNDIRSVDKTDFAPLNISNFVHSWEKGVATYVQRLNEIYLNSNTISQRDVMLAKILAGISYFEYCRISGRNFDINTINSKIGLKANLSPEENFFNCLNFLTSLGDKVLIQGTGLKGSHFKKVKISSQKDFSPLKV